MNLDKGLKRKQKRNGGKSFFLYFVLFVSFLFFRRQNVKVRVVQEDVYSFVPGCVWWFNPVCSTAPHSEQLRRGCTSEYFNCANSSSCTVSESVMCIKPSAERCLLLEGFVFVFRLSLSSFVIVSVRILASGSSGGKKVVNSFLLSAALRPIFYLSCIFCCLLLFLFKIIFH